jgi:hypothetical protein
MNIPLTTSLITFLSGIVVILQLNIITSFSQDENNGELIDYVDETLGIRIMYPDNFLTDNPDEYTLVLKPKFDDANEISIMSSGKLNSPCNVLPTMINTYVEGLINAGFELEATKVFHIGERPVLQNLLQFNGFMYILSTTQIYDNAIYTINYSGIDSEKYMSIYLIILASFNGLNKSDGLEETCDFSVIANDLSNK